jgi:hypothetical protein
MDIGQMALVFRNWRTFRDLSQLFLCVFALNFSFNRVIYNI